MVHLDIRSYDALVHIYISRSAWDIVSGAHCEALPQHHALQETIPLLRLFTVYDCYMRGVGNTAVPTVWRSLEHISTVAKRHSSLLPSGLRMSNTSTKLIPARRKRY